MLMLLLSSCTVYRHVPDEKQLVTKVNIKGAPAAHREVLGELIAGKPNTKIFGLWRLRTRNWYVTEKWRKRRGKEQNTIWEEPTYYSETATAAAANKMQSYLKNQGYFNASVTAEVKIKGLRKRKAEITYRVKEGKPYMVRRVYRNVEDYSLYKLLEKDAVNSLVKQGKAFSSTTLVEERERLTNLLRSNGFYDFNREYIYFDLDSTLGNKQIDIYLGLKNPGMYDRHKVYRITSLVFTQQKGDDTTTYEVKEGIKRIGEGNTYLDGLVLQSLRFEIGELYNQAHITETLKNLRKLRQYQYVDLSMRADSLEADTGILALKIVLTPYMRFQTQLQAEVITSEQNGLSFDGRLYGMAGSLTFRDLNFARRGIQMETRLRASSELSFSEYPDILSNNALTLSHNYYFAKPFLSSLMPISWRDYVEQSTLTLNGFWESNPDFRRSTANIGVGYFLEKGRARHYFLPVDFNLVSTKITSESFQTLLDTSTNLYLSNLFDNHTIAGSRWGYYYSNKTIGGKNNYFEVSANLIEVAGNLFSIGSALVGQEVQGDLANTYKRTFAGMHFFQYLKGDYDFRYHQKTFWNNEIVYRGFLGMVYPIGNTPTAVPFEKRYFTGGSNSVRGWAVRSLGPGSYRNENDERDYVYFRTGDIKLEANVEYRFTVSQLVKMAVFMDAGNIWNHPSNNFQVEGGDWQWDRFYKEFAVAGGLGTRFDFTYFVFRTDIGIPFRDPAAVGEGRDKWFPDERFKDGRLGDMFQFNFGIGYPF